MNRARIEIGLRLHADWLFRWVVIAAGCTALLMGCAAVSPPGASGAAAPPAGAAAPSLGLFSRIKVPGDRVATLALSAQGVQIFRCERRESEFIWVFRQPDAQLLDADGKAVGRHGANFSFEHVDGSRLVSTIAAYDEAPNASDLRWLLLTTRSFGAGSLAGVTHVQRVNTRGGMPPPKCDAARSNQLLRVDFSADFIFYRMAAGTSG